MGRFISSSAKRCLPFFKTLKDPKNFQWSDDCTQAFQGIKTFLTSPPLLSRPIEGETLYLYLATTEETVAAVLIREEEGKQLPIYYISKVLHEAELNYPRLEKLAYALLIAT